LQGDLLYLIKNIKYNYITVLDFLLIFFLKKIKKIKKKPKVFIDIKKKIG